jgi:hypothetical protein
LQWNDVHRRWDLQIDYHTMDFYSLLLRCNSRWWSPTLTACIPVRAAEFRIFALAKGSVPKAGGPITAISARRTVWRSGGPSRAIATREPKPYACIRAGCRFQRSRNNCTPRSHAYVGG